MKTTAFALAFAAIAAAAPATAATPAAEGATVKVTPLGSHDGEFCALDRAMVFEDPDGTRILYDPGRTVRGADDPRLGQIDAVLLTHVHGDHLGDAHTPAANAGECGKPDASVKVTPNSNTVNIVVGKKAKLVVGGEMHGFLAARLKAAGGDPKQVQLLRFGGSAKVGGVAIASVPAVHSNGLDPAFLDDGHAEALKAAGLTAYVGPPGGYVLKFSNSLVAYLSGDTGVTAEQDLVVRRFYNAKLAVINIGGTFTTGPAEAAYVINEMVKPNAVIASHANEAATRNGQLLPETRTAQFGKAVTVPMRVPLSGRTMTFDADAKCLSGC
ncbi:MBL fold metallo-hydrolase [Aromatoleum bremense]|uniref:MBL fold metallo-hydrolase n=1 Tax=Aromatoleum bremense TaxID=76115 RepID=A0ABX1NV44_9RHOO|nr:MBL fold metallo-hydrolase [Aromatoleum bremense]NMG15870.1 MBL fold metallo-hydrolase [Aromatoleum bremense]QTQ32077.1 Putative metal-dependent hydrolase [Aromatoleum bremense]